MTDLEAQFDAFPVDVRLTLIGGLQDTILLASSPDERGRAADVLVRLGYPESADSALRARATLDGLRVPRG